MVAEAVGALRGGMLRSEGIGREREDRGEEIHTRVNIFEESKRDKP